MGAGLPSHRGAADMSELDLHIKNYVAEIRARLGDHEPMGETRFALRDADNYLAGHPGAPSTGQVFDALYNILAGYDAQHDASVAAIAAEQAWLDSPAAAELRKEIAAEQAEYEKEIAAKRVEIGGGAAADLFPEGEE